MPVEIRPKGTLGDQLVRAGMNAMGSYGTGYSSMAPQLMQALPSGVAAGNAAAAPLQSLADTYTRSFSQSFNYLAQAGMQADRQKFEAEQNQLATDRAFRLQDANTRASLNEVSMRQTGRPMTGIGQPGTQNYIAGWQDDYNNYVANTLGPPQSFPEWQQSQLQQMEQQRFAQQMQQKGYEFGIPRHLQPEAARWDGIISKLEAGQMEGFPAGAPETIQAIQEARSMRPKEDWYRRNEPTPDEEMAQAMRPVTVGGVQGIAVRKADRTWDVKFPPSNRMGAAAGGQAAGGKASKGNAVDDFVGAMTGPALSQGKTIAEIAVEQAVVPRGAIDYIYDGKTVRSDDTRAKLRLGVMNDAAAYLESKGLTEPDGKTPRGYTAKELNDEVNKRMKVLEGSVDDPSEAVNLGTRSAKAAPVGEVRMVGGVRYRKEPGGTWKKVMQ